MNKTLFSLTLATLLMVACGQKRPQEQGTQSDAISIRQNVPGDSTLYGLACDGCTDSVLVVLPYSGGDPDTFDVVNAFREHRIYGRPHIGDELAVIINPDDREEALMVIDMEELKGEWCYLVTPTFRHADQMSSRISRRMTGHMPDSIRKRLLQPREYSLRLKRDNTAMAQGGPYRQTTTDDMSPVEFPTIKHYTEWSIYNGRLVLKADTIPGLKMQKEPESDTVAIRLLMKDSLVLEFTDHIQSYYRKAPDSSAVPRPVARI